MKILICFKVLPDPDRILPQDWDRFSSDLDLSYAGLDFNCFDGSALELGLQLKEKYAEQGTTVSCSALTLGDPLPGSFSERLYSIGFQEVLQIPANRAEFCPETVAEALSQAASSYDLILTGREAGMAQTGMVPYLMGETLHIPVHADVEGFSLEEGRLLLHCRREAGLTERKAELPCILTVGNSPAVLRAATLRQRMKCRGREANSLSQLRVPECPEAPSLRRPDTGRHCRLLDPEQPETWEFLHSLLHGAVEKKREREKSLDAPDLSGAGEKLILYPDTEAGRRAAVREAKERNLPCFFGGEPVSLAEDSVTVRKRVFGSNLQWDRELSLPAVLTGDFGPLCEKIPEEPEKILVPAEKTGLQEAPLIFVCGNGMGSREACDRVRSLAKRLGAGFGLTRPGALNAWGGTQEIVGQSGWILSPGLTVTLGASGAGAFLLGIEKSETILAVNTDPNALIFRSADYGIQMDAGKFVEKLGKEGRL